MRINPLGRLLPTELKRSSAALRITTYNTLLIKPKMNCKGQWSAFLSVSDQRSCTQAGYARTSCRTIAGAGRAQRSTLTQIWVDSCLAGMAFTQFARETEPGSLERCPAQRSLRGQAPRSQPVHKPLSTFSRQASLPPISH